jgi:hypothetical protein
VHPLNSDGVCNTFTSLGSGTTDESGNYSVTYYRTDSSVCVAIYPINGGNTRVFDEKLNADVSVTDPLNLINIVSENSFSGSKRSGIFLSPFSKMLTDRVQILRKEAGQSSDMKRIIQRASKEVVIRFGLNKGFSSKFVSKQLSDSDYPELNDIPLGTSNTDESKKFLTLLAGFSQLANKNKSGTSLTSKDIESVITSFSEDFSDGVFDGKDSKGQTVMMGGKPLGANALSNQLLSAVKEFVQEGGQIDLWPGQPPLTISLSDLNTVQFNETGTIAYSEPLVPGTTTPSPTPAPTPVKPTKWVNISTSEFCIHTRNSYNNNCSQCNGRSCKLFLFTSHAFWIDLGF